MSAKLLDEAVIAEIQSAMEALPQAYTDRIIATLRAEQEARQRAEAQRDRLTAVLRSIADVNILANDDRVQSLIDARSAAAPPSARSREGLMSEWQPMRDAPRDRWVLLWTPHRHCAGGMTVRGRWDYRRDEWAIEVDINMRPWIDVPTHWMPFPAPPTEGGER